MKKLIKRLANYCGYEISTIPVYHPGISIGSDKRPVGDMRFFLEDIKERGFNCKTFLDVGANNGNYSRMVKQIYPDANFYLVEPQLEMKAMLDEFCNETNNAKYFLAAAGASKDRMVLTIWDDFAGSSLIPLPDQKLIADGRQREIEIITIDDLITSGKITMPEFIKLDIQGFEVEALKGASKTFGYTEVYIIEVSLFPYSESPDLPVLADVLNFMLLRDYVVYDFPGFLRRPYDGALGQCDICFVKKNGFLKSYNGWN